MYERHQSCVCDAAFTGPKCAQLNLLPADADTLGQLWNRVDNTASWGGNVVRDDSGLYHMFFAEFLNHCGLDSWGG